MSGALHEGHRERLRERYLAEGPVSFNDHQLLELLLFYCIPRRDTNATAHKMIEEFGSLTLLFDADTQDIQNRCQVSAPSAVLLTMIPDLARRYYKGRVGKDKPQMYDSGTAGEYVISLFSESTNEAFYVLCLNAQRRLLHAVRVGEGTVDEAPVYPREIAAAALRLSATRVILAHNHPGGSNRPSSADIEATKAIINALNPLSIEVVDHIIAAGDQYFSFAARGLLGMAY